MGSSDYWPTALYPRILAAGYEAGDEFNNKTQKSPDRSEYRVNWDDGGRTFGFTVRTRDATEKSSMITFFRSRKGDFDPFWFTPPGESSPVYVKFATGSLPRTHVEAGIYDFSVSLVSVA